MLFLCRRSSTVSDFLDRLLCLLCPSLLINCLPFRLLCRLSTVAVYCVHILSTIAVAILLRCPSTVIDRRQASSLSVVIILRHRQPSSVVYCFQLCSPSSVAATVRRLRFRCAFVDITPCLGLRRMSIVVLLLCVSIVAMMTESVHL